MLMPNAPKYISAVCINKTLNPGRYGKPLWNALSAKPACMKKQLICFSVITCILLVGCKQKSNSQQPAQPAKHVFVGGGCEGCEAVFESPVPFEQLNETDTLPGFDEPGQKLLVEGVIYKPDGQTPAPGVVLYVYHTSTRGLYESRAGSQGWAKRHGDRRGWVKTNERGEYRFYTVKPASYPNTRNPAHIHPTIKEPGLNEYYIDEFVFDDDPLLVKSERDKMENRGGNGILKTTLVNGMLVAKHDIILGLNIPNYPK